MPIQFRCGSCNQLLGIATRKAGHVVNCPTCGQKTVVPRDNGIALKPGVLGRDPKTSPGDAAEPDEPVGISLLDRVDMDALLAAPKAGHPVASPEAAAPAVRETAPAPKRDLELTALPRAGGADLLSLPELDAAAAPHVTLVLTPTLVTVLIVVLIALLAGMLLLGMWLGSRFAA